jgi:hypothetical protein
VISGPGAAQNRGDNDTSSAVPTGRRSIVAAGAWPRPTRPRLAARLLYRVQPLLAPSPAYRRLARWLAASPRRYRIFTAGEKAVKSAVFGCRMCGQCTLPVTGYACPMTCPKQLRNGPCGGVGADGSCEVYPAMRCVWVRAHERAGRQGRVTDLTLLQRPVDQSQLGRSSWVSYWDGHDDGIWTGDDGLGSPAAIFRPEPTGGGRR